MKKSSLLNEHNVPLVQIVHVSDLHMRVRHNHRVTVANSGWKWKLLHTLLEGNDVHGWAEGMVGHDYDALHDFNVFLEGLSRSQWGAKNSAETWIVDTGDATTFGDDNSFEAYVDTVKQWQKALGACGVLVILGNHDLWPGCQPVAKPWLTHNSDARQRRARYAQKLESLGWAGPLRTSSPAKQPYVSVHTLDTLSCRLRHAVMAIGKVENSSLRGLTQSIQDSEGDPSYRVLAMHHPLSFPYPPDKNGMILSNAVKVAKHILNEKRKVPSHLQPLIHLVLSGHTHERYPASALGNALGEIAQLPLGERQLQLVAGSLILGYVHGRRPIHGAQISSDIANEMHKEDIMKSRQQFQILRLLARPTTTQTLALHRDVLVRTPRSMGYRPVPELRSETLVHTSAA